MQWPMCSARCMHDLLETSFTWDATLTWQLLNVSAWCLYIWKNALTSIYTYCYVTHVWKGQERVDVCFSSCKSVHAEAFAHTMYNTAKTELQIWFKLPLIVTDIRAELFLTRKMIKDDVPTLKTPPQRQRESKAFSQVFYEPIHLTEVFWLIPLLFLLQTAELKYNNTF